MDKLHLDLDFRFWPITTSLSKVFHLTKLSNGNDTRITWMNESDMESKQLIKSFNTWKSIKTTIPNLSTKDMFSDNNDWGHTITKKDPYMIQITMNNISNLGIHANDNPKQEAAVNWLCQNYVDVASWIEVGIAWHMLRRRNRLQQSLNFD